MFLNVALFFITVLLSKLSFTITVKDIVTVFPELTFGKLIISFAPQLEGEDTLLITKELLLIIT